ncbi:biopolymer transporter ExbD [Achromobacter sp. KS-M25]|nr:biopolymer transporter ExbD [Achromobacter aestuarii]MYZ41875.1 biopolymer transporter ExbD [Achromobacter aestuarii]
MAFGSFDNKGSGGGAMSEINMVPLIDVMLVLLVIFIITAPLLSHSIKINLPQVSAEQVEEEPKVVDFAIDPAGQLFIDEQPVALEALQTRFAAFAAEKPQPQMRIRADLNTRYEVLAEVMGAARRAGMTRIGFVTTPKAAANSMQGSAVPGGAASSASGTTPTTGAGATPAAVSPAAGAAAPARAPAAGAAQNRAPASGTTPAPAGR